MKKYKALNQFLMILIFVSFLTNLNAQTGLNFQGVARTASNAVIASQDITLKLSILQGSATGLTEYIEVRKVTTNAQGLFTAVIGDSLTISTLGKFSDIDWKLSPKFLKIEIDPAAGNNFITMGTTQFQFVAYAKFANSVLAENISGIVPVARGGTGSNSLTTLKSNLALDKVNNTADSSKPISNSTQSALDQKLNIIDSTKAYVTPTQLARYNFSSGGTNIDTTNLANYINMKLDKSDTTTLSNRINSKLDKSDITTLSNRINLKLDITDTSSLFRKSDTANLSNRINLKLNSVDTASLLRKIDTTTLSNRIDFKLNISDTTSLFRKSDTSTLSNRINLKLDITDTSSLFRKSDTASLSNRINLKLNSADTSSLFRKSDTTNLYNRINLKLNSADTSSLFRKSDTASLSNRINLKLNSADTSSLFRKSDTTNLYNRINLKLNINDTAILLRKSDTATLSNRIDFKLNINDTSSLLQKSDTSSLSNRINLKLNKSDTSTLSNRINLKLNISDTSNLLRKSQVGAINGAASLDAAGKIPSVQIPAISFSSVDVVDNEFKMLNLPLTKVIGAIAIRLDLSKNFVLAELPASNRSNWVELVSPTDVVQTVNGKPGPAVAIEKSDIGLINVDNTSDINKPVSDATKDSLSTRLYITDTSLLLKKSDTSFLLQKVDTTAILAMYAKKFTKDVVVNFGGGSLGKYANGTTIPSKGKTLDEFLLDLVSKSVAPSFTAPSVSIGANPGFDNYEIGYVPGLVTFNYTYTANNGGGVISALYYKDASSTPLTGVNSITLDTLKTTVSFKVVVNYAKGTGTKPDNLSTEFPNTINAGSTYATNNFTPYSKRYWGGITSPFLENQTYKIEDFNPSSDQNGINKGFSFNFTPNGRQYIFVAYLASNAADITKVTWGSLDYTFTKSLVWFENARGYKQLYKVFTSTETYDAGITGISTQ